MVVWKILREERRSKQGKIKEGIPSPRKPGIDLLKPCQQKLNDDSSSVSEADITRARNLRENNTDLIRVVHIEDSSNTEHLRQDSDCSEGESQTIDTGLGLEDKERKKEMTLDKFVSEKISEVAKEINSEKNIDAFRGNSYKGDLLTSQTQIRKGEGAFPVEVQGGAVKLKTGIIIQKQKTKCKPGDIKNGRPVEFVDSSDLPVGWSRIKYFYINGTNKALSINQTNYRSTAKGFYRYVIQTETGKKFYTQTNLDSHTEKQSFPPLNLKPNSKTHTNKNDINTIKDNLDNVAKLKTRRRKEKTICKPGDIKNGRPVEFVDSSDLPAGWSRIKYFYINDRLIIEGKGGHYRYFIQTETGKKFHSQTDLNFYYTKNEMQSFPPLKLRPNSQSLDINNTSKNHFEFWNSNTLVNTSGEERRDKSEEWPYNVHKEKNMETLSNSNHVKRFDEYDYSFKMPIIVDVSSLSHEKDMMHTDTKEPSISQEATVQKPSGALGLGVHQSEVLEVAESPSESPLYDTNIIDQPENMNADKNNELPTLTFDKLFNNDLPVENRSSSSQDSRNTGGCSLDQILDTVIEHEKTQNVEPSLQSSLQISKCKTTNNDELEKNLRELETNTFKSPEIANCEDKIETRTISKGKKKFKLARQPCPVCKKSVSIANLNRHLQNLHPGPQADCRQDEVTEYFYFCLECEAGLGEVGREVPLGMDLAAHNAATGHTRLQPILSRYPGPAVRLANLSYSRDWGGRVRRCWKRLVLAGEITQDQYTRTRTCLRCGVAVDSAVDMFLHIKSHLSLCC